jgi:hypothetical protein
LLCFSGFVCFLPYTTILRSFWERDWHNTRSILSQACIRTRSRILKKTTKESVNELNIALYSFNSSSYLFTDPCYYRRCSEDLPELRHPIYTTRRHQWGVRVCNWSLTLLSSWFMYFGSSKLKLFSYLLYTSRNRTVFLSVT